MRSTLWLALVVLVFSPAAGAQTAPNDSQTLQSILKEIQKLREDLQATAVTVRRTEILLYRVQMQQAVVNAGGSAARGSALELG